MLLRFTRRTGKPVYLESGQISAVDVVPDQFKWVAQDLYEPDATPQTTITCGNELVTVLGQVDAVAQFVYDWSLGRDQLTFVPTFNPDSKVSE